MSEVLFMSMQVWYLYHSGFAVKTEKHFLVFDYYIDTPAGGGLSEGVIDPAALANEDVVVFASHAHGDHYNPVILSWRDKLPKLRYVLSNDIREVPGAEMLAPDKRYDLGDLTVETLLSTDEGAAFLVGVDGAHIYHAGDLNWWHWTGETDQYNRDMAALYKSEIGRLKGRRIDLAFVPVDPRLGETCGWGIDYLMKTADVRHVIPMHFGDETAVVDRLLKEPASLPYRDRIMGLTRRGENAVF